MTVVHSVEDLFESLGGFSNFQVWAMFVIISPEIVAAMVALSPIFTSSNDVPFLCRVSENDSYSLSAKELIDITACNGTLSPMGIYTSVVQEWSLVGNKAWISDLFTSLQMLGSMLGALVASQAAEKYGRKKAHYSLCFIMGLFGFCSGIARDPYTFAVTRFLAGFAVGGCFVVYINYLMEFLTPSYRTICGCVSLWAVGEMGLALIAYLLPNWRLLTMATSAPIFLIFLTYPWFPESPRWLLCQEKSAEALSSFDTIARWNGKGPVEPGVMKHLQNSIPSRSSSSSSKSYVSETLGILKRHPLQLATLMLGWFTCQIVYYGLSFNMKHLSGVLSWNVFWMGVLDLPGSFTGIIFNNRWGRKRTFLVFLFLASLSLFALIGMDVGDTWFLGEGSSSAPQAVVVLSLLSRYLISTAFGVLTCVTAESFPTNVRVRSVGICAFAGNLGSICAPQFAFLGTVVKSSHFISFGALSVITFGVSFNLKDTVGKPLEDSLQEKDGNKGLENV